MAEEKDEDNCTHFHIIMQVCLNYWSFKVVLDVLL